METAESIDVGDAHIYCLQVGPEGNYPLIVLHGGPGLDHTEMHPWLDPLGERFRLIYVDLRGQGQSDRVDPATLSLDRFAADVDAIAAALGLERYALLGHSFGSIVALAHAIERGCASLYILSGCTASFTRTAPELEANLQNFEPAELRQAVIDSWAMEPNAKTQEDVARIMEMQMPFHFASVESEGYRRYMQHEWESSQRPVYSPEVLAHFAAAEYPVEYEDRLGTITKPALIVTGEYDRTCTPRASRDLHAGIPNSELVIIPDAGHMTYIEQPEIYFSAVNGFFDRNGV